MMKVDVNYMKVRSSNFAFKKHAIELYMSIRRYFNPEESLDIVHHFLIGRIEEMMDREGINDVSDLKDHEAIKSCTELFSKPIQYWEQVRNSKLGNLKRISYFRPEVTEAMKEKLVVYKCTECGFTVAIQTEEPVLFDGCADTVYQCDGKMNRVGYGILCIDVPEVTHVKPFIGDGEGNVNPTSGGTYN